MKIISSTQLKELDKYTIAKEPVASIDLMERAAEELTRAITPPMGYFFPYCSIRRTGK